MAVENVSEHIPEADLGYECVDDGNELAIVYKDKKTPLYLTLSLKDRYIVNSWPELWF